jgi:hypothetical protein
MVGSFPQGLKPLLFNGSFTAGLKACSTPRGPQQMGMRKGLKACSTPWDKKFQGLKPKGLRSLYAALKGRSSTMGGRVLPQRLKPALIPAETAGINACSTPWGTADGLDKGINACSSPWGKNSPGLKPRFLRPLYAALKGRSSTADLSSTMRVKVLPQGLKPQVFETANGTTPQPSIASLPQAKRSSRALTLVSAWTLLPHQRGGASMGVR